MAEAKNPSPKKSNQAKPKSSSGVFDIARPGKGGISASSNSRSVIIKHQLMPDPMVNNERRPDLPVVLPSKPATGIKITPLSHDDPVLEDEAATAPLVESESTPEDKIEVKLPVKTLEPIKKEEPELKITPETKIADVAPEPDTSGIPESPDEREADNRVARERAAKLQRMIDNEEYFLPIETLEERRSRKVAIFGVLLIIVLAVAWYNVALDAGLLQNTYNLPHTTFFTVK